MVVEWFFIKADCEQEIKSWDERYSFILEMWPITETGQMLRRLKDLFFMLMFPFLCLND